MERQVRVTNLSPGWVEHKAWARRDGAFITLDGYEFHTGRGRMV
ncbi:MAG: hypothetical protein ACLQVM_07360 [Terriglobia bacterium]